MGTRRLGRSDNNVDQISPTPAGPETASMLHGIQMRSARAAEFSATQESAPSGLDV
jgi:hypothetical protein